MARKFTHDHTVGPWKYTCTTINAASGTANIVVREGELDADVMIFKYGSASAQRFMEVLTDWTISSVSNYVKRVQEDPSLKDKLPIHIYTAQVQ